MNLPKAKRAVSRCAVDRLAQSKVADVELLERMMIEQEEKQSDHLNSLEYKWRDVLNQLQKATDQMKKSQLLRSCVNQAAKAINNNKNEMKEIFSATVSELARDYPRAMQSFCSERDDNANKVLDCDLKQAQEWIVKFQES